MVEGLYGEQGKEEQRPKRKGSGAAGKGHPEGTGWAALPGPRVRLSPRPVWLRSQSGARPGMVCLKGWCERPRGHRVPARWSDGLQAQGADQNGGAGGTGQARRPREGSGPGALIQEATLTDPSCVQTPQLPRTEQGGQTTPAGRQTLEAHGGWAQPCPRPGHLRSCQTQDSPSLLSHSLHHSPESLPSGLQLRGHVQLHRDPGLPGLQLHARASDRDLELRCPDQRRAHLPGRPAVLRALLSQQHGDRARQHLRIPDLHLQRSPPGQQHQGGQACW